MKTAHKLLVACVTVAGLIGFSSQAKADTAAGSAAFTINNAGVVTGVSMSAAVSEDGDSLAVGMNTANGNATFALGSTRRIDAPAWARPADRDVYTAPGTEMVANEQNIYIYGAEPEYYAEEYFVGPF